MSEARSDSSSGRKRPVTQPAPDAETLARQTMLHMCGHCLQLELQVKHHTLALFDEALELLDVAAPATDVQARSQHSLLLLMTCACLAIVLEKVWPAAAKETAAQLVVRHANEIVREDNVGMPVTQEEVLSLKAVLLHLGDWDDSRPLVTDHIAQMHASELLQSLPEFRFVSLDTCYCICDLLFESSFRGCLKNGGKLFAVYAIEMPLDEVPAISMIKCLAKLSCSTADLVKAQASLVMHMVLDDAAS